MTDRGSAAPRAYDSAARRERGRRDRARTRRRILTAARDAFLEHGYAATALTAVAARAEVSVQTIYLAVGAKPDLLRTVIRDAVLDGSDRGRVPDLPWVAALAAEPSPAGQLDILVTESARLAQRAAPLWRVLADAARVEPGLRADLREQDEGRLRDQRALVSLLRGLAVPTERAADIVHAVVHPTVWDVLVDQRGWSADEARALILRMLKPALLGEQDGT